MPQGATGAPAGYQVMPQGAKGAPAGYQVMPQGAMGAPAGYQVMPQGAMGAPAAFVAPAAGVPYRRLEDRAADLDDDSDEDSDDDLSFDEELDAQLDAEEKQQQLDEKAASDLAAVEKQELAQQSAVKPAKKRRHLASLDPSYAGEEKRSSDWTAAPIQDQANLLSFLHRALRRARKLPEGDAEALARFKHFVDVSGWAPLASELQPMSREETITRVAREHADKVEFMRRQEIPVKPDGTLLPRGERRVTYDRTQEQRDKTKVTLSGAELKRADGKPVDTKDSSTAHSGNGVEIFVTSATGVLHMASHVVGKYHHSSLLAGATVAMAGEMKVTGGRIVWMSNKSGHYTPSAAHFVQFLHHLDKAKVPLDFGVQGWGVPDGKTAREYLDGLTGEETYDADKSKLVWAAAMASPKAYDISQALRKKGWIVSRGGAQVHDGDGKPVPLKDFRKLLKEVAGERGRSMVTEGTQGDVRKRTFV
jgi:hypothetical protein